MIKNSKFKIKDSDTIKAYLLVISGDVQGVSYRYFAKKEANGLGLLGWTKNEHDGTVSIFIQGDSNKIEEFTKWAREGSPMATVNDVIIKEVETNDLLRIFEVR